MDSFGQLNYVGVTIEKSKKLELNVNESGKMKQRYKKILEWLDPGCEKGLSCMNSILKQGDSILATIRTYQSKTNATAFGLNDEKISENDSLCVVFDDKTSEISKVYLVKKDTHIDREDKSSVDISETMMEKMVNTENSGVMIYSEGPKLLNKLLEDI